MKHLFTFLFSLLALTANAQFMWEYNFDPASPVNYSSRFVIDTVNYKHNIWQIGLPHKAVFDSAHSKPFAMITDTANTYPVKDTSVFILKHKKYQSIRNWLELRFYYKLQLDSGEVARLEVSGDTGHTWYDVVRDTAHLISWVTFTKPRFDTSSITWQAFDANLAMWSYGRFVADTLLYRFTFISDSNDTHKDGWVMDDFHLEDEYWGAVSDVIGNSFISVYPNPSPGDVYIKQQSGQTIGDIEILTLDGKCVYKAPNKAGKIHLNLPNGTYLLRYCTDDSIAVKRLVIEK